MEFGSTHTQNFIALIALLLAIFSVVANPTMLDNFWPYRLSYQTDGLECKQDNCELKVQVENQGWATQKDVQFMIPQLSSRAPSVYSNLPFELIPRANGQVISISRLHPGAFSLITLNYPHGTSAPPYLNELLKIDSDQTPGTFAGPSDFIEPLPTWWYVLTCSLLSLAGLQIVYRFLLESPKQRYIRLLVDLNRLMKQQAHTRAKLNRAKSEIKSIPHAARSDALRSVRNWPKLLRPRYIPDDHGH